MRNSFMKLVGMVLIASLVSYTGYGQKEEVCYNPNLVPDTTKRSIKSVAEGKIGKASFSINYHSPGVRSRILWGGLVPYDEVWVTGAHDATAITFDQDVVINSVTIPAGKYAFFTIPGKKEWIAIINKKWNQHLASEYDAADDIVRIKVKPQKNKHLERLQYFVEPTGIAVAWEKVKINIPVTVKE